MPDPIPFILASRSPRRLDLLREAGYDPVAVNPPFDDPPTPAPIPASSTASLPGFTPQQTPGTGHPSTPPIGPVPAAHEADRLAQQLALAKALSLAHAPELLPRGARTVLILAADTIVVDDQRQPLGQPADREHAAHMLHRLLGRWHWVLTGAALLEVAPLQPRPRISPIASFTDAARVCITPPSADERTAYLDSGRWHGKAGGYNLAELRDRWSFEVRGDPATVIGLPMRALTPLLATYRLPRCAHSIA